MRVRRKNVLTRIRRLQLVTLIGVVFTLSCISALVNGYRSLGDRSRRQSGMKTQPEQLELSLVDDNATTHVLEVHPVSIVDNKTIVVGKPRTSKVFLLIGIPSVRRISGNSYLLHTLQSVVSSMTSSERSEVKVVVFLADLDPAYNQRTADVILKQFGDDVNSGLMTILRVLPDYYPRLEGLHRNFGDSAERVRWRAKQVADYAALFAFSAGQSQYYLQLEDDVQSTPSFVSHIKQFIKSTEKPRSVWAMLEFSELGFIGKLFRTEDLDRLSRYMNMFYAEQPVDWLMIGFRQSMGQRQRLIRNPTLFQHFGVKSSFDTSRNNDLKDRFFAGDPKMTDSNVTQVVINDRGS